MAHIVVFGGTGFSGRNIVSEAAGRGHSINVVSPNRVLDGSSKDEVSFKRGSILDAGLVDSLARSADVLAVAVPARISGDRGLLEALPALLAAGTEHGVRLGFVGASGTLRTADGTRLADTPSFPPDAQAAADAHDELLEALLVSETEVNWFVLSPSAQYGAAQPGEDTGQFRLGKDDLLMDSNGVSAISGADFAHAFVDEIDRPQNNRARFTVGY